MKNILYCAKGKRSGLSWILYHPTVWMRNYKHIALYECYIVPNDRLCWGTVYGPGYIFHIIFILGIIEAIWILTSVVFRPPFPPLFFFSPFLFLPSFLFICCFSLSQVHCTNTVVVQRIHFLPLGFIGDYCIVCHFIFIIFIFYEIGINRIIMWCMSSKWIIYLHNVF